jgi:hypothetical protein
MSRVSRFSWWFAASLCLSACLGQGTANAPGELRADGAVSESANAVDADTPVPDQFAAANRCLSLQRVSDGALLRVEGNQWAFAAPGAAQAASQSASVNGAAGTPLLFRATDLGEYLLFTPKGGFVALQGGGVVQGAPSDLAQWRLQAVSPATSAAQDGAVRFTLTHMATGVLMGAGQAASSDERLPAGSELRLLSASACAAYPEIDVQVQGAPFSGKTANGEVLGFADAHVHWGTTRFLGDAHYGAPFHKFGVTPALGDCKELHGQDGRQDYVGNLYGGAPTATHATAGWPGFASWPAAPSLTHESMYYKWVERAWRAGLRLMVNEAAENEALCTVVSTIRGKPQNCNEMDGALAQMAFLRQLERYVDAQNGGPGKGWFRIVTSAGQARSVIESGKLAVVLGIEISHLFNCTLKYAVLPGQSDTVGCDEKSVDEQLDRLWQAGVRQAYTLVQFDNALGGNGIFEGTVLNVGNRVDTGRFWSTYDCPEEPYFYDTKNGAIMGSVPGAFNSEDPLSAAIRSSSAGYAPVYRTDRKQCNTRSITPLGRSAITKMMDRGIIIDIDHVELRMKSEILEMAKARNYPIISSHGGHGGITQKQALDIFRTGGLIYDYKGNGQQFVKSFKKAEQAHRDAGASSLFAFGYGADTNGLGPQAVPRSMGSKPVRYPFGLFEGADWGALFKGVPPVTVGQQKSGTRSFDINREGMAHYGLAADFVEEVRLEGGADALNALYRSAEAYLQMWERAERASRPAAR